MKPNALNADLRAKKEIWGLTGGVASGKSTAAKIFEKLGISVIDADQISRGLSQPGGLAHAEILAEFGTANRAQLRALIFSDTQARAKLEAILHPKIHQESLRLMGLAPSSMVIYEAALLVETGRHLEFSGLIVVDASRDIRKQRLILRDHTTDEEAEKLLNSQISDEKRLSAATVIFKNSGSLVELEEKVRDFISIHPSK